MKKLILIFLCFCFASIAWAEKITVDEILVKMENAGDYTTSRADAVMKIINSDGDTTEMGLTMFSKRGEGEEDDKSLMRFTSPARLKGTAILMNGDSIWYYNHRTNRVRLLSKSAKKGSMMGSGFSYEDLSTEYAKDFTGEILEEDKKTYQLKLFPKNKDKKYQHLLIKVRKADYQVDKMDYFDKDNLKYKELSSKDFKKVSGRIMPMQTLMKDLEADKKTVFEINPDTVKYDLPLKDSIFSERNLRK